MLERTDAGELDRKLACALRGRVGARAKRLLQPCRDGDGGQQCLVESVGAGGDPSEHARVGRTGAAKMRHLRVRGLGRFGRIRGLLGRRVRCRSLRLQLRDLSLHSRRRVSSSRRTASAASPANQSSLRCGS